MYKLCSCVMISYGSSISHLPLYVDIPVTHSDSPAILLFSLLTKRFLISGKDLGWSSRGRNKNHINLY